MSNEAVGWVWKNSPYKGIKFIAHLAVADIVNDTYEWRFFASNSTLAVKCRTTRQSINEAMKSFVDDGYMEVLGSRSAGIVEYRFLFGEGVSSADTGCREIRQGVSAQPTGVSAKATGGVGSADTELESELQVELELEQEPILSERDRVWDAYLKSHRDFNAGKRGNKDPVYSPARKQMIDRRLASYSVEELILAVTGWTKSSFHTGQNDEGKVYNSIDLILRNDEKIEMFIGYHAAKKPASRGSVNEAHGIKRERSNAGVIELGDDDEEDFIDD